MGLSVIHFGIDTCNRVPVLENAGYIVESCRFVPELKDRFNRPPRAVAVVIDGLKRRSLVPVLTVIHGWPEPPPIVLFEDSYSSGSEQLNIDLVVPPVTPPEEWLSQLAGVIKRSRAMLHTAAPVREQSQMLRMESEALRANTALVRHQLAKEQENYRNQKQAAVAGKRAQQKN